LAAILDIFSPVAILDNMSCNVETRMSLNILQDIF